MELPLAFTENLQLYSDMKHLSDHDAKDKPLTCIINIAENICNSLGIGRSGDLCVEPIKMSILKRLNCQST
jgi:hypothetical protein